MSNAFPYIYTPERAVPWHQRYRAEGRSFWSAAVHVPAYLLKARRMKRSAPPEELAHFESQRRLRQALAGLDAPRAAPAAARAGLAAVGDLMWIRSGWGSFLSPEVLSYLNRFDVVLGNLESVISRRHRVPSLLPDHLRFNSDARLVTSFARPGGGSTFSALAVTNNHMLDFGERALLDTLDLLDGLGIPHSGVRTADDDKAYVLFERNGIKIGFTAVSWGLNNSLLPKKTRIRLNILPELTEKDDRPLDFARLRDALDGMRRDGADFRIVSAHWGHEYEFFPTPRTMQTAREIVRAGADLVVGSHPHVSQPDEVLFVNGCEERYGAARNEFAAMREPGGCLLRDADGPPRKALVMYSLGNFVTFMSNSPCDIGTIEDIELFKSASGVTDWRFTRDPNRQLVRNRRDRETGHTVSLIDDAGPAA